MIVNYEGFAKKRIQGFRGSSAGKEIAKKPFRVEANYYLEILP